MKKLILLVSLLLNGCAVYNTPGPVGYRPYYPGPSYDHRFYYHRHFDPYNSYYHKW